MIIKKVLENLEEKGFLIGGDEHDHERALTFIVHAARCITDASPSDSGGYHGDGRAQRLLRMANDEIESQHSIAVSDNRWTEDPFRAFDRFWMRRRSLRAFVWLMEAAQDLASGLNDEIDDEVIDKLVVKTLKGVIEEIEGRDAAGLPQGCDQEKIEELKEKESGA